VPRGLDAHCNETVPIATELLARSGADGRCAAPALRGSWLLVVCSRTRRESPVSSGSIPPSSRSSTWSWRPPGSPAPPRASLILDAPLPHRLVSNDASPRSSRSQRDLALHTALAERGRASGKLC